MKDLFVAVIVALGLVFIIAEPAEGARAPGVDVVYQSDGCFRVWNRTAEPVEIFVRFGVDNPTGKDTVYWSSVIFLTPQGVEGHSETDSVCGTSWAEAYDGVQDDGLWRAGRRLDRERA